MAALPDILTPLKVFEMSPELITRLTLETEQVQHQRKELTQRLAVLNQGVEICRQFVTPDSNGKERTQVAVYVVLFADHVLGYS